MVGQVTAVPSPSRSVAFATPPRTPPHERALSLAVDPGVEMIGNHREGESRILSESRVTDKIIRAVFLARKFVADRNHTSV